MVINMRNVSHYEKDCETMNANFFLHKNRYVFNIFVLGTLKPIHIAVYCRQRGPRFCIVHHTMLYNKASCLIKCLHNSTSIRNYNTYI